LEGAAAVLVQCRQPIRLLGQHRPDRRRADGSAERLAAAIGTTNARRLSGYHVRASDGVEYRHAHVLPTPVLSQVDQDRSVRIDVTSAMNVSSVSVGSIFGKSCEGVGRYAASLVSLPLRRSWPLAHERVDRGLYPAVSTPTQQHRLN
jgi:hypothetical protein